jgi:hypothetical protein
MSAPMAEKSEFLCNRLQVFATAILSISYGNFLENYDMKNHKNCAVYF